MSKTTTSERYWIERENGHRIDGPYSTSGDALLARVWVERVMTPETFGVRSDSESQANRVRVGAVK